MDTKEFIFDDLFDIVPTKKKINANTVKISSVREEGHPYIVRTSQNNGLRGYIECDSSFLNPGNTFSFGQDTATIFWHEEPYFTGDKMLILTPKFGIDTDIAMYILAAMRKAVAGLAWGESSFDVNKVIKPLRLRLPYIDKGNEHYEPDYEKMRKSVASLRKAKLEKSKGLIDSIL